MQPTQSLDAAAAAADAAAAAAGAAARQKKISASVIQRQFAVQATLWGGMGFLTRKEIT